ncbi:MAG: serine protease [Candidatus Paceibacterota bacterium]
MVDHSSIISKIKPSIALVIAVNAEGKPIGTGSGFVFSKKNILVTCNHVIKDVPSIFIKFPDVEQIISAKTVVRDEEHDLALLKFDDKNREPLKMIDIKNVKEGMGVLFAGYPLSMQELTTHQGILSAITKDITGAVTYLIDGTVNSGNSGCPLMDENGMVIGIVNAKRRERSDLLTKVENMSMGAVSLHGVDLVEIYHALINNVQLGIGYAVPASYIPEHKEIKNDAIKKEEAATVEKVKSEKIIK